MAPLAFEAGGIRPVTKAFREDNVLLSDYSGKKLVDNPIKENYLISLWMTL